GRDPPQRVRRPQREPELLPSAAVSALSAVHSSPAAPAHALPAETTRRRSEAAGQPGRAAAADPGGGPGAVPVAGLRRYHPGGRGRGRGGAVGERGPALPGKSRPVR